MNPQLWWYVARATGVVAWMAAVGAVLVGLALSSRIGGKQVPPAWLLGLHRHLGALTAGFTAAHVVALIADSYVHFDLVDVLVPMASGWRQGAVAWGVVGMWLLAAVEVSSLLKRRLRAKTWRAIHLTSYLAAVAATTHMAAAGTDFRNPVLRWAPIVAVSAAATFLTYRAVAPRRRPAARAAAADLTEVAA
jgi:DMSO/TMAO reductase YedYZ heme-binding membrane subunit